MKKRYIHFVPRVEAEKGVWAANVSDKIATYGPTLGLDATAVTAIQTAAQNIQATINAVETKKREMEEAVSAKNQSLKDDLMLIQNYAGIIKRSPGYMEQIGSALGFIATTVLLDEKDLQPNLTGRTFEGKVEVGFDMQTMNSITIYSRMKGTTGWTRLGNDKESPFVDTRPLATAGQPEIREYTGMYFDGKEEIGQMAKIITVVFAG